MCIHICLHSWQSQCTSQSQRRNIQSPALHPVSMFPCQILSRLVGISCPSLNQDRASMAFNDPASALLSQQRQIATSLHSPQPVPSQICFLEGGWENSHTPAFKMPPSTITCSVPFTGQRPQFSPLVLFPYGVPVSLSASSSF